MGAAPSAQGVLGSDVPSVGWPPASATRVGKTGWGLRTIARDLREPAGHRVVDLQNASDDVAHEGRKSQRLHSPLATGCLAQRASQCQSRRSSQQQLLTSGRRRL